MNVKQIIKAGELRITQPPEGRVLLNVSEFFYDTIQGEGISTGVPSIFLRLQNCTLNCVWCDSREVWRKGNPYTSTELLDMMEENNIIDNLIKGHHWVITGGSPLLQQDKLLNLFSSFEARYNFIPFIEIENECTITPIIGLLAFVSQWNNSPKLSNSGNHKNARYNTTILKTLSTLSNSWFKFVVNCNDDWKEIVQDYLEPQLIKSNQIILMPEGATRTDVMKNSQFVVDIAIQHGVRYCTREHVILWDKQTGV